MILVGQTPKATQLGDVSDVALRGIYINGPLKNQKVKKEKL
jgi:hypothetical protein